MAPETHDTAQVAETSPDALTQPKSREPEKASTRTTTVIVITSVLLSMFLVALDRTILATVWIRIRTIFTPVC